MQTANVMVHIGGDSGTIVPKYAITASEIAVLRAIHGAESITEIEPTEDVKRSDRDEIVRLNEIYGRAKTQGPNGDVGIVASLFPGAAARAFQTLDELYIEEDFYKATGRVKPEPAKAAPKAAKAKKSDKDDADPEPNPADVEAALAAEDKLFD
ncbi:hypothetical protein LB543_04955 [Mesorhizobium sp. ESP7-2]|uniref:hypothetical protein n=1 Tax=Mesorhizobium sp. ESP7-2 TaxID=2876622 RepID=UPI001CCD8F96|nr:hypothetical protein [Mesorhizobium sp. ESP7-2]MBZ9706068.1 hypothetical protein [Mesorhizobium sp. ESP7-2]